MSPRRITKQQKARITRSQQKHVQRLTQTNDESSVEVSTPAQEGLLIAHYGSYVDIEGQDGKVYRCNIRQNLGSVVAGDQVIWQLISENTGVVVAVLPRKSLFSRNNAPGKIKPLVANADQVIVVIAPQPKPVATILDGYLVAIETFGLRALLVCNKRDLIFPEKDHSILDQIAIYHKIGYPVLLASAQHGEGLLEMMTCLRGQTSIFVGQSGVGKSSLIGRLLPETSVKVDTFSPEGDHGMHTTTTARLYHLPAGGDLIDSPGVRDFVLWDMPYDQIARGFVEFRPYLGHCQFRDCRHFEEPDCALRQAVANGSVFASRLASYQSIVTGIEQHG